MAEAPPLPTPPAESYTVGQWIIRRFNRNRPVRLVAIHPWSGVECGFLVEHDGTGPARINGADVRPCPPDRIPRR